MFATYLFTFLGGAAVVACLWVRSKVTYPALVVPDAPVKGNPSDTIVVYGQPSFSLAFE